VADALGRVGAGHLRRRPPHRLSGGEKRAAAIAAVLAMGPSVLVLDEPSSNLDPASRRAPSHRAQRTSFRNVRASRMIPMTTATNTAPQRKTPNTSRFRYSAGSR
jgi:ABC-type sulfate/molybdate transport systems ATPase subunit